MAQQAPLQSDADRAEEAADRAEQVERDITDHGIHPDAAPIEVAARVAYAAIAVGSTYVVGVYIFDMEPDSVKEVCLLNGGVAYYTHEAAGKVVAALNQVYVAVRTRKRNGK